MRRLLVVLIIALAVVGTAGAATSPMRFAVNWGHAFDIVATKEHAPVRITRAGCEKLKTRVIKKTPVPYYHCSIVVHYVSGEHAGMVICQFVDVTPDYQIIGTSKGVNCT